MNGVSIKTTATKMGHKTEQVTLGHYIDGYRIATQKMEVLDKYIESVVPKDTNNTIINAICEIKIDDYLPI